MVFTNLCVHIVSSSPEADLRDTVCDVTLSSSEGGGEADLVVVQGKSTESIA